MFKYKYKCINLYIRNEWNNTLFIYIYIDYVYERLYYCTVYKDNPMLKKVISETLF